jgi:hypothetical protein
MVSGIGSRGLLPLVLNMANIACSSDTASRTVAEVCE